MKKKIFIAMLIATMSFSIVACGSTTKEDTKATTESSKVDETKKSKESSTKSKTSEESTETTTESSEAENAPAFTYTDKTATLYATQSVNVRDLPDTSGNKVGSFATNDEVVVTGQCNETGWYRIAYNGGTAYVSNAYVASEKVAVQQPKNDAANSSAAAGNGGGSASAGAPSGNHVSLSDAQAFFESHGWAHAYIEGNSVITYTAVVSGGGVFEPAGMEDEFLSYTTGRNYQGNGPLTWVWEDNSAPSGCLTSVVRHEFPLLD